MSSFAQRLPATSLLPDLVEHAERHCSDIPLLLGVELQARQVKISLIPLRAADPVGDLESLVAPDSWEYAIVAAPSVATHWTGHRTDVRLIVGVSRSGDTHARLEPNISTSTLAVIGGQLAAACHGLFADAAPVVPRA